jgi:hypothetical protein
MLPLTPNWRNDRAAPGDLVEVCLIDNLPVRIDKHATQHPERFGQFIHDTLLLKLYANPC